MTSATSPDAASAAKGSRRNLRFDTINDALSEADRLVAAEREGRLVRHGNWALGQTLGHLATWANFAFDGYPPSVHAPWFVRLMVQMAKRRILTKGMMPGIKFRGIPGGTLGTDALPTDEGLRQFRAAMVRLHERCPTTRNPVFGLLTHSEWIALNLRHAELHLGFLDAR
jgi:hypothetical protein